MYPVFDREGKEVAALYGTPGKELFTTAGVGPIRGMYSASNGRSFAVSGSSLYEIDSDGTVTVLGALLSSSGIVTIDDNGVQLFICDGQFGYTFTYSTDTFAQVLDPAFPSAGTVCFLDGYFIVNENDTGKFYISALYDGTSWNALDFATAESSPDELKRVYNALGQLWLIGTKTTEIWTNTGDADFPFQRISGAKMNVGIMSPYTALEVDNTLFWVGQDDKGFGIVYRAAGFRPQRISTDPIEQILQRVAQPELLRSYTYQQDGHSFYLITGGDLETTLVYDVSTQLWHERAYLNAGNYEQDRGCCSMFVFNKHLVGDRANGKIYEISLDFYDDAGDPLCRDRIYTHLSDEGKDVRYNKLEIGLETGVGNQVDPGQNPLCSFRLSKDGARTWSEWYTAPIGPVGQYLTKVRFRRLGIAEQMTFNIRITDPIKVAICGSYLF